MKYQKYGSEADESLGMKFPEGTSSCKLFANNYLIYKEVQKHIW